MLTVASIVMVVAFARVTMVISVAGSLQEVMMVHGTMDLWYQCDYNVKIVISVYCGQWRTQDFFKGDVLHRHLFFFLHQNSCVNFPYI